MVHVSAGCKESFSPILADILADIMPTYGTESNVMLPVIFLHGEKVIAQLAAFYGRLYRQPHDRRGILLHKI